MEDTKGYIELPPTHIRDKPDQPSPNGRPGGASGSGTNWTIGFGSGGGFSGGFGGSSRKKAKKRRKAKKRQQAAARLEAQARARAEAEAHARAEAEALARAEAEAARVKLEQERAAHRQLIESLVHAHAVRKAALDDSHSTRLSTLAKSIDEEIRVSNTPPKSPGTERWQLYLISKEKSEIEDIIGRKKTALHVKTTEALAFDGHDPLLRGPESYRDSLSQYSAQNSALARDSLKQWESAYSAALEVSILPASIKMLEDKSRVLTKYHAEQELKWREIEALYEHHRQRLQQRAVQREEQINYKVRLDEHTRQDLLSANNRFTLFLTPASAGVFVLSRAGTLLGESLGAAMLDTLGAASKELLRIAAIRVGQTISVTATAVFYSAEVGNGELTPEQRRRLYAGVGVPASALGVSPSVDLHALATAGGSVELGNRIKAVPLQQGVGLSLLSTGGAVAASVPVVNAVFDAQSSTYQAQFSGSPPLNLVFRPPVASPSNTAPGNASSFAAPFKTSTQVLDVPEGVDTRIKDCIVCFPAESGVAPHYFSFEIPAPGTGIVVGKGQPASANWWQGVHGESGAAIPSQIGDHFRQREFTSVAAFDKAFWRAVADDPTLRQSFDDINIKRMARGFAPYAPKNTWSRERRAFEIRHGAANDAKRPYDLDTLSITAPNSPYGVRRFTPSVLPWPVSNGNLTWTPLIPPGAESLGPTALPTAPQQPPLYPGQTTDPAVLQGETLPAVDPADTHASIPGYGEEDDLPSPGLVFAGPPVEKGEVGKYKEMAARSRGDGLDIDHIPSRKALEQSLLNRFPDMEVPQLRKYVEEGPSVAISSWVNQKYSETYGGRNSKDKVIQDGRDISKTIDRNLAVLRPGLLEDGFSEAEIDIILEKLHITAKEQGLYL